ncbi:MAG: hypothetical protein EBT89_09495, partial [Opitutaceae bacterium]|nr:hypothetical protein [Opitutaceae bacterium]
HGSVGQSANASDAVKLNCNNGGAGAYVRRIKASALLLKLRRCSFFLAALMPSLVWAVYAPIPEQEQGKALTYRLGSAIYQDSNIFGGATGEISSLVYNLNGALSYNGSLSDQTFASAAYELNNDHVVDRPGKQNLTSHILNARLAHAFSPATSLDFIAGGSTIEHRPV